MKCAFFVRPRKTTRQIYLSSMTIIFRSAFLSSPLRCLSSRPLCQRRFSPRLPSVMASAKQVLVPVANGSEEMEAVIIIDVLRRCGDIGLPCGSVFRSRSFRSQSACNGLLIWPRP